MSELTYAAKYAHEYLMKAKQELSEVKPSRFSVETPSILALQRTLDQLILSMDTLIRSGHFIEPEPKEGGHKI